jgi:hypothetical protein
MCQYVTSHKEEREMKDIIEIEWLHRGQPQAYADSIYECILTFIKPPPYHWKPSEDEVKALGKIILGCPNAQDSWDKGNWYEPYIDELKQLADNQWRIKIKRIYLD